MKREISNISSKKATPKGDIPVKILKWNSDIIAPVLTEFYNQNIKNSTFPNELKNADIAPVYNKKDRHDKSNYRPASLDLLVGFPQGSILGPLLFNVYMCDLVLCDCESNIINYADDTTFYACDLI